MRDLTNILPLSVLAAAVGLFAYAIGRKGPYDIRLSGTVVEEQVLGRQHYDGSASGGSFYNPSDAEQKVITCMFKHGTPRLYRLHITNATYKENYFFIPFEGRLDEIVREEVRQQLRQDVQEDDQTLRLREEIFLISDEDKADPGDSFEVELDTFTKPVDSVVYLKGVQDAEERTILKAARNPSIEWHKF